MRITINENENLDDIEIIINCKRVDEKLLKAVASLRGFDEKLTGERDGKIYILDIDNVFYFESVDKKTFIYMDKEVYETGLRLYEIEDRFSNTDFFRASKSTIINLSKIKELTPAFGGRIEVILENEEKQVISRQYVPVLKKKLDL